VESLFRLFSNRFSYFVIRFSLGFSFGDLEFCHAFLIHLFSDIFCFIDRGQSSYCSVSLCSGVAFQAAICMSSVNCSTTSFSYSSVFKGVLSWSILQIISRKSAQFVLLLWSAGGFYFLNIWVLYVMFTGEWSEDRSRQDSAFK
jgi:hypothetical protein